MPKDNNRIIELVISVLMILAALAGILAGMKNAFSDKR